MPTYYANDFTFNIWDTPEQGRRLVQITATGLGSFTLEYVDVFSKMLASIQLRTTFQ